jgi:hypothetical protein
MTIPKKQIPHKTNLQEYDNYGCNENLMKQQEHQMRLQNATEQDMLLHSVTAVVTKLRVSRPRDDFSLLVRRSKLPVLCREFWTVFTHLSSAVCVAWGRLLWLLLSV